MNRKDCEHLGYLLASRRTREELRADIFAMDARIEIDFDAFEEIAGHQADCVLCIQALRDEATLERFEELMLAEYGAIWSYSKRAKAENRQKEIWQQAHNEVRGIGAHDGA